MRRFAAARYAAAWGLALAVSAAAAAAAATAPAPAPARIEARSTHYLLVGVVQGDSMSIHVSRRLDNAPVADAAVTAALRGKTYAATAESDGGYSFHAADLNLPGSAAIRFEVAEAGVTERLLATLRVNAPAPGGKSTNGARQLGWWILNFAVCLGLLALIARRRKNAQS
ncbi:MAG TPA: hypothetical protein VMV25_10630 [Steroidobacteraceae bacterium]|nr:hypothetical protein [Steroidobacteraceae bacterium]